MSNFKKLVPPYTFKEYYSKYPQGYTLYEAILDWINQVNEMVDQFNLTYSQWENMQLFIDNELTQHTVERLNEMIADGTLTAIINEELLSMKVDSTVFNSEVQTINSKIVDVETKIKQPLYWVDYNSDFIQTTNKSYIPGQVVYESFLTEATVIGSTEIKVASVTNLLANELLVIGDTNGFQILEIENISSNTVTLKQPLKFVFLNNSKVSSLWQNQSHLTSHGMFVYFVYLVNKKTFNGSYLISREKPITICVFGNSWFSQHEVVITNVLKSVNPNSTVVHSNTTGNNSDDLINRLSSIPVTSDIVLFNEPGVNDVYRDITQSKAIQNLSTISNHINGLGAIGIYTGFIELNEKIELSRSLIKLNNNVFALKNQINTFIPKKLMNHSIGLGFDSLASLSYGEKNVALGNNAGKLLTGSGNVVIGNDAGYKFLGSVGNALTNGYNNVLIGNEVVGSEGTINNVAVGYLAKALHNNTVAIGYKAQTNHPGGVAIGVSADGTSYASTIANNDFCLGSTVHTVRIPGRLNISQKTPTSTADSSGSVGDVTFDSNYLYVKTSAGWKRVGLTTW